MRLCIALIFNIVVLFGCKPPSLNQPISPSTFSHDVLDLHAHDLISNDALLALQSYASSPLFILKDNETYEALLQRIASIQQKNKTRIEEQTEYNDLSISIDSIRFATDSIHFRMHYTNDLSYDVYRSNLKIRITDHNYESLVIKIYDDLPQTSIPAGTSLMEHHSFPKDRLPNQQLASDPALYASLKVLYHGVTLDTIPSTIESK